MIRWLIPALALTSISACATSGSNWMSRPLTEDDEFPELPNVEPSKKEVAGPRRTTQILGEEPSRNGAKTLSAEPLRAVRQVGGKLAGRVLGKFRNTYYDFPAESEFKGAGVALKNPSCETIKTVPRGFFEAVCVQGSGTLANRQTVSFAKRDCGCAEICPKTNQKICFDALDPKQFPYGRGATGGPITPLYSVAVDSNVIPLGTALYIPELEGMPRDAESTGLHDGCFLAQDRGLRVKGKHVDIFTGETHMTRLWNKLVPSNEGVTVVLDSPRCARAGTPTSATTPAAPTSDDDAPKKERKRRKSSD